MRGRIGINWNREFARALRDGETCSDLAARLGCSKANVSQVARGRGIVLQHATPTPFAISAEMLASAAIAGETANAFCRRTGHCSDTLRFAEKRHGIALQRTSRAAKAKERKIMEANFAR